MPLVEVQSVLAFISRLSDFVAALSASGGYRKMTRWNRTAKLRAAIT
jgi:hypothetical protein